MRFVTRPEFILFKQGVERELDLLRGNMATKFEDHKEATQMALEASARPEQKAESQSVLHVSIAGVIIAGIAMVIALIALFVRK
jgi:hypothetical protein